MPGSQPGAAPQRPSACESDTGGDSDGQGAPQSGGGGAKPSRPAQRKFALKGGAGRNEGEPVTSSSMHHEDSGDAAVAEGVVWHRATCPERGRDYFYTRAGETRWDPPGELLYGAAFEGDAGAVASLLGLGAAADYSLPEGGATSLYVACESGRPEVARHLVEARADPNLKRHDGATPLLAACSGPEATRHELASLLARGGARPDPAALRYAVHSGSLELVQLLLDHGASPNPNPNPNPTP